MMTYNGLRCGMGRRDAPFPFLPNALLYKCVKLSDSIFLLFKTTPPAS